MRFTHVGKVDLNLLRPLYVLLEERHVSRAAQQCGLSQPAMSRALERLRASFQDQLLVRIDGKFERTVRGDRLFAELQDLLPRLETVSRVNAFEPATSRHVVRIAATDYASVVIIPRLLERLVRLAPRMQTNVVSWNTGGYEQVDSGRADVALVGEHDRLSLESEKLFVDDFVCIVSQAHPHSTKRITLKSFVSYPHVEVAVSGGRNPYIENVLGSHGARRRVILRTPSPISAILTAGISDLIYTTPRRLATILEPVAGIRILEAPKELTSFSYAMAWHRRMRDDVLHLWLRSLIKSVAQEL